MKTLHAFKWAVAMVGMILSSVVFTACNKKSEDSADHIAYTHVSSITRGNHHDNAGISYSFPDHSDRGDKVESPLVIDTTGTTSEPKKTRIVFETYW